MHGLKKRLLELIYPRSLFCNLKFTFRNRKIVVSCPVNSYNINEHHVQNGGRKMALGDKLSKLRKENNFTQEQIDYSSFMRSWCNIDLKNWNSGYDRVILIGQNR